MSFQRGSFRGEFFRTTQLRTLVGQRRGVYELPYDDNGAVDISLGRKPRRFTIDAMLIANDYGLDAAAFDRARNDFIAALEQPGPGLLVHPSLGSVLVIPGDQIEIAESPNDDGVVHIRFEAVEARDLRAKTPQVAKDRPKAAIPATVSRLNAAAADRLVMTTTNYPAFVSTSRFTALDNTLTALRKLNGFVSAQLSTPSRIATELDAIADEIVRVIDTPRSVAAELQHANEIVIGAVTQVVDAVGDLVFAGSPTAARVESRVSAGRALLLAAQTDLAGTIPDAGTRDTPARAQERINTASIRVVVRTLQFAALMTAVNDLDFDSRDEADTILEAMLERADQILRDDNTPAEIFDAVDEGRAQLQTLLRNLSITPSTTIELATDTPACLIAFRLYGDSDREDEIVARNSVANPLSIPGGTTIEVLIA